MTSNTGKNFLPRYPYGPRPQPSAAFSYDHNPCRAWFDIWLSRGGNVARDAVYLQRAIDLPDLRNGDDRLRWFKLAAALRIQRATLRLRELAAEVVVIKKPTVITFKPRNHP